MKVARMLLVVLGMLLVGCSAYKYDSPKVFGLRNYVWSHLSRDQREQVIINQTSPTARSVNEECFNGCLEYCIPNNDSGSTGVNKKCFNRCIMTCTPIPSNYFNSNPD
jgi:hypothetical protein